MKRIFKGRRPSPALVISLVALMAALAGTAAALPGTNTVDSGDIINKQVKNPDLNHPSVGLGILKTLRATPTTAATDTAARQNAPKRTLYSKGNFKIYGKCWRGNDVGEVSAQVFIQTTTNGATFRSILGGDLEGGSNSSDLLNTNTPELSRGLTDLQNAANNGLDTSNPDSGFWARSSTTQLTGLAYAAAKQGNLSGGNGAYGAGNVCLFGGYALG